MKRIITAITAILILCFAAVSWGATLEGVTLTGPSINAESLFIFDAKTTGAVETFTLPIYNGGSYNFLVDWGDAQTDTITAWNDGAKTHTYAVAGTYQVMISGEIVGWKFANAGSKDKIYDIKSWGPLKPGNSGGWFYGCSNLTVSATDVLDLTGVTSLYNSFRSCTSLTALDVSLWDISSVATLRGTFRSCTFILILDVSLWDTSSVTDLGFAFNGCTSLTTLDVSLWDTSSVTDLGFAFNGCLALTTLDVSLWDTSSVTDLRSTFDNCLSLTVAPTIVNWNIPLIADATDFLDGATPMTTAAYDAVLIAWAAQEVQDNVTIHFGAATYTGGGDAAAARAHLVLIVASGGHNWSITDGGIN